MASIQQGLREDGFEVSMVKLCRWFGVARRSVYYKPVKATPKVKPELAEPIRELIEAEPSFGYRTVAGLLGMNKEHGPADLSAQGLAGAQAGRGPSSPHRGIAFGRYGIEPALGDRPVPGLGRQGWLAEPGPGDRLSYPATAGLAAVA